VVTILAAYLVPSIVACWTSDGFCPQQFVEQEFYLLAVGLLLYVCGYVAAYPAGRIDRYIFGVALGAYIAIAVVVLVTRDNLTRQIEPPFIPLLIERNDLALLVADFFVWALFRPNESFARIVTLLVVVAVAGMVSPATQSRLVAMISILGILFFVRIERRVPWWWWIALGVAVACFLAIGIRASRLVLRALSRKVTSISLAVSVGKRMGHVSERPVVGRPGGFAELFEHIDGLPRSSRDSMFALPVASQRADRNTGRKGTVDSPLSWPCWRWPWQTCQPATRDFKQVRAAVFLLLTLIATGF
jgi:hypothetical protein